MIDGGSTRGATARILGIDWRTADKIAHGCHVSQCTDQPFVRCGGCGGLVQLPCQLCRLRALQQQGLLALVCEDL